MKIFFNKIMDCIYGIGFYDRESGIVEIWVGVLDNVDEFGNVKKMEFIRECVCFVCLIVILVVI